MDAPPLIKEGHPPAPEVPRMSLAAKLLNVFAVPGEVFNDVKRTPPMLSNWVVPVLLAALVGAVSVVLLLSQPSIQKQFQERQRKFIEQADQGRKLTPQEQQMVETLTGPTMLKLFGAAGAVASSFISLLWWGFCLYLIARRMLRVPVGFGKALEVAGLAMMIDVLYGLVAVLLIVKLDKVGATSSLALIIKDFDAARKGHLFAVAANIFAFWVIGVRSVGLAKLADVSYLRAAWLVISFWFLQQLLLVMTGVAQLAM
jgi:hypothetical protein